MIRRGLTLAIILAITTLALAPAANAMTCAETAIEARGEQSRFVWSAKGKARANWRSKVRRTPGLGDAYANWARAQNTDERCLTGPAGTLCIFVGTPCIP
ncbi:MAG TPA: hypothetical protein PLD46_07370 [Hyphomicrobium sp.]|mgnify:CR=1 FL=1|nr:hypothetical protein [Hyphomicrobium sp.]